MFSCDRMKAFFVRRCSSPAVFATSKMRRTFARLFTLFSAAFSLAKGPSWRSRSFVDNVGLHPFSSPSGSLHDTANSHQFDNHAVSVIPAANDTRDTAGGA